MEIPFVTFIVILCLILSDVTRMFDKLKVLNKSSGSIKVSAPAAPAGQAPTVKSIYQSRNNFGVNLGSVFVLEKFMYGDFFIDNSGAELDAISRHVEKKGIDKTRKLLEKHWGNYMSQKDWKYLASKGVQAVRIPIGYWGINGGEFAKNTNFAKISPVYQNCWKFYKQLIETAKNYKIGVLVDLHALPKGANTGDHSGEVLKNAGFWESSTAISIAIDAVTFIAHDVINYENVCGLQIVNESEFSNDGKHQKKYYTAAINAIRSVNADIPIVISDGWWPDQWVRWINDNSQNGDLGVIIDTHIYRCFADDDKKKSPEQIIEDLDKTVLKDLSGKADILIGEYSCVLDGDSWSKTNQNRAKLVQQYGQTEQRLFKQRAKCGSYFWTFKFQYGDGGEWGFVPMVESGSIPARQKQINLPSEDIFNNNLNQLSQGHENYWRDQNPNEKYEHWRYKEGFITAWCDSNEFAKFDASELGRVVAWTNARKAEHIKARGGGRFVWEWEAGFQAGLDSYRREAFGY
ncbi:hypothetical protein PACTADRAFT_48493 [Pachysolen tannophilus NRRL Y-2460]|uniref:Glycoside hydrolase family 5 domain-containing protein n=1 Tax=Pachysolen tannophilus NRRL Y-2460 TaxID=669874 RepID=A0A1E4TY28_PACTA|nr:hypothetical protein PACTADRAFT_48493 [Pachysolen tannophilus NRRL Y-2460]